MSKEEIRRLERRLKELEERVDILNVVSLTRDYQMLWKNQTDGKARQNMIDEGYSIALCVDPHDRYEKEIWVKKTKKE